MKELSEIQGIGRVLQNEPMKNHTTMKVGGPCDWMLVPSTEEEIIQALKTVQALNIPYMILGNGSNLLVRDGGIRGAVIKIGEDFSAIRIEGETLYAEAGALLSTVAKRAAEASLAGLEFASGIPGTIGGAMVMNAGAYGGEMKDVTVRVRVLDGETIREIPAAEMGFAYRYSHVLPKQWIVLGAEFCLQTDDAEEIQARIDDLTQQRTTKQPLEWPSAGSTFKRPEGYFAGKLIDDAGLRGFRYKDAQVSEKHCGFVINRGNASFQDIQTLIESVQKAVYEEFGVHLEREVKVIGEDLCE